MLQLLRLSSAAGAKAQCLSMAHGAQQQLAPHCTLPCVLASYGMIGSSFKYGMGSSHVDHAAALLQKLVLLAWLEQLGMHCWC